MRDIFSDVEHWRTEASPVALATVVKVSGSAPRPLGSKMAVSSAGEMVGSVSGGCVEGAVYEEARSAMQTGRPKLLRFGISDEQAWGVGLMCGGEIEVFVEPLSGSVCTMAAIYQELKCSLEAEEPVALATVLTGRRIGAKLQPT